MSEPPSPERILGYSIGAWMCGVLATAAELEVFAHIEEGVADAGALARRAGISPRGARALLDALVGLGLVHAIDGGYQNDAEARHYLVPGRPDYLGDFVALGALDMASWGRLTDAVRSGEPLVPDFDPADHPAWDQVIRGAAPVAHMLAQRLAETLDIEAAGPIRFLDVGGGAGALSGVWLALNRDAQATQIDWPRVNRVARDHVAGFGVGDRFTTVDGDLREIDYGAGYDLVVFSMVTHFFAEELNIQILRKAKQSLAESGVLVIADMMANDDGTGDPWALAYAANMLLATREGATHRRGQYASWARAAGFSDILFETREGLPHTILYAR